MIKAEVIFDGDSMFVNGWRFYSIGDEFEAIKLGDSVQFVYLDDLIKYCLEN